MYNAEVILTWSMRNAIVASLTRNIATALHTDVASDIKEAATEADAGGEISSEPIATGCY